MTEPYVKSVDPETRELNRTSPTALKKFDPSEYGGCMRRWYLRYVMGAPEPQTASQELGVKLHKQVEHYLLTGQDVFDKTLAPVKQYLPKPGTPGLMAEACDIEFVKLDGLPVVGQMDIACPGDDETPVPFTRDLKTTSDVEKYSKSEDELRRDTQMTLYARELQLRFEADEVEVSHIYASTDVRKEPDARMVSVRLGLDETTDICDHKLTPLVVGMREVAREKSWESVQPNFDSCDAYRRRDGTGGCPYKHICKPLAKRIFNGAKMSSLIGMRGNGVKPSPNAKTEAQVVVRTTPPLVQPTAPAADYIPPEKIAKSDLIPEDKKPKLVDVPPGHVLAGEATQGKEYVVNSIACKFLCVTAMAGTSFASFAPANGGVPLLVPVDQPVIVVAPPPPPPEESRLIEKPTTAKRKKKEEDAKPFEISRIAVRHALTVNLGGYQSVRVEIELDAAVNGDLEECKQLLREEVMNELSLQLESYEHMKSKTPAK